eukprot:jgi/Botrbrau1/21022/Bobra.0144s0035.1
MYTETETWYRSEGNLFYKVTAAILSKSVCSATVSTLALPGFCYSAAPNAFQLETTGHNLYNKACSGEGPFDCYLWSCAIFFCCTINPMGLMNCRPNHVSLFCW